MITTLSSEHSPAIRSRQRLAQGAVRALIAEQLLVGVVGAVGGLWPEFSSVLLRVLVVGLVMIDVFAAFTLLALAERRVRAPRMFAWAVGGIILAAVAKNFGVAGLIPSVSDLFRLLNIPLWLLIMSSPGVAEVIEVEILKRRRICIAILVAQLVLLAAARLEGWGGAYLSGDPLVGVLIYPLLLRPTRPAAGVGMAGLAGLLVIMSFKRTAWISATIGVVLIVCWSVRGLRLRRLVGLGAAAVIISAGVAWSGFAPAITSRLTRSSLSFSTVAGGGGADASLAQRNDEVAIQIQRMREGAPTATILGLSSEEQELSTGKTTHAIHNTHVFLLTSGGLLWLLAVLAGRQRSPGRIGVPLLIGAVVTMVDGFGGNSALNPSFGIAFAVISCAVARAWRGLFSS